MWSSKLLSDALTLCVNNNLSIGSKYSNNSVLYIATNVLSIVTLVWIYTNANLISHLIVLFEILAK